MEVTKQTVTGDNVVAEYEAKHSIELGQTAKGEWYCKSIKIYANSTDEMINLSVEAARKAEALLKAMG